MPEPTHHSFMLRLWRERRETPWRVTLLAVAQPDERHQFDTLEDCFAWLQLAHHEPGTPLDSRPGIVAHMEATEK
jgi:hypothetical protein